MENILNNRYGSCGKKWKISLKSVTVLIKISKKVKNDLTKCYGCIGTWNNQDLEGLGGTLKENNQGLATDYFTVDGDHCEVGGDDFKVDSGLRQVE